MGNFADVLVIIFVVRPVTVAVTLPDTKKQILAFHQTHQYTFSNTHASKLLVRPPVC